MNDLTQQLAAGTPLTAGQVNTAVDQLLAAGVPDLAKADFLCALARKGETVGEITAFAIALRAHAIVPPLDAATRAGEILDVCGTGGDRLNTFNISTTVALVCAAAGVAVAKHGNRAVTSKSGSADVLEALGIRVDLPPEGAAQSLREHGFAFFFAPHYHPTFRQIKGARQLCAARGQRTIFNLLGPLLNPARPSAQLMGVPRPEWCATMAPVLQALGVRRAMVVCGRVGEAWLDELSTLGDTEIAEFYQDHGFSTATLAREHYPLQPATLKDLAGGDGTQNAGIIRQLLANRDHSPRRDAVLLNAGAGLFLAGRARSILEGWELAAEVLADGRAEAKLRALTGRG